ncbi:hypothetical protein ACS0TY_006953 [Phlomoides rotata]
MIVDSIYLQDDNFDLVAAIKCASYYRRGKSADYVSDFLSPKPSELEAMYESYIRWVDVAVDPVMCSTLGGKIVRGLAGIPSEGPVLLVGNHMMLAMDGVPPLLSKFWIKKNIMVRGMAHPMFFERFKDISVFDVGMMTGGVPVSPRNLYRLLSLKSHVLLHPGGGEGSASSEDEPEFVRMAARFGAKIIPFGVVGEDDVLQLLLDCDDQMKIPPLKALIEELTSETVRLRSEAEGEIGKQILYYPVFLPKLPGHFYFLFGKPILTEGRKDVLRNKDKAQEMYFEVQTEIEKCIAYLKEKRDPYRNLLARLVYQASHGFNSQVPTFNI